MRDRQWTAKRQWSVRVVSVAVALIGTSLGVISSAVPASATATATPACTFNGSSFPLLTGISAGSKIVISCTGLPALHPYLLLQASLLIGIDPKAEALLSGGSLGVGTLEGALAALPEIDAASFTPLVSDLNGDLTQTYTVPTFQPTDPNASCPPTTEEFNSGLIGCALTMIDLTTQKPLAAGSAVMEYAGAPIFPPGPTLALSAKTATPGQQVNVSDAHGATRYWWLATLSSLEALLGGGTAAPPTISVEFLGRHSNDVSAANTVTVTPATYNGTTLTPPVLAGTVTVPAGISGPQKVLIGYTAAAAGINVEIGAQRPLTVDK
jgi:hypothetical protein